MTTENYVLLEGIPLNSLLIIKNNNNFNFFMVISILLSVGVIVPSESRID